MVLKIFLICWFVNIDPYNVTYVALTKTCQKFDNWKKIREVIEANRFLSTA
jgi:hypothetical protein